MDGYSESCKLILCCDDDLDVLESVKGRCKVVKIGAPATHEVSFHIISSNFSSHLFQKLERSNEKQCQSLVTSKLFFSRTNTLKTLLIIKFYSEYKLEVVYQFCSDFYQRMTQRYSTATGNCFGLESLGISLMFYTPSR